MLKNPFAPPSLHFTPKELELLKKGEEEGGGIIKFRMKDEKLRVKVFPVKRLCKEIE